MVFDQPNTSLLILESTLKFCINSMNLFEELVSSTDHQTLSTSSDRRYLVFWEGAKIGRSAIRPSSLREALEFSLATAFQDGIISKPLNLTMGDDKATEASLSKRFFNRQVCLSVATHSSRASSIAQFAFMAGTFSQVHLLPWFIEF